MGGRHPDNEFREIGLSGPFYKGKYGKNRQNHYFFFLFENFHPEDHPIEKKFHNQSYSKLNENSKNDIENFVTHCLDVIMTSQS